MRCAFQSAPGFFGLTPNDKDVYLEPVFLLVYYMGMNYTEAYHLPIWKRNWYLERLVKEIKKTGQSKGATPQDRAMGNSARPDGPHRTRRFT